MKQYVVMSTAEERKARRETRLLKEEKRRVFCQAVWTGLKYIGAFIGTIAAAIWLAIAMQENTVWAMETSWFLASIGIGTFLFHEAAK